MAIYENIPLYVSDGRVGHTHPTRVWSGPVTLTPHTWNMIEQLGMTLGGLRSSLYTFLGTASSTCRFGRRTDAHPVSSHCSFRPVGTTAHRTEGTSYPPYLNSR